jgi:hypothetical protein
LLCALGVVTASAGSACPEISPVELDGVARQSHERPRVPKSKARSPAALRLEHAYARTHEARHGGAGARAALEGVIAQIETSHPHEWLLVWNVLEALVELGVGDGALIAKLERRLHELETYYGGRHPIATGLGWLSARRSGHVVPAAEAR